MPTAWRTWANPFSRHERAFNLQAGLTAQHDRLPEFFKKELLPPHNLTFQVTDQDLDKVFNW